jgi:hypothetical protein
MANAIAMANDPTKHAKVCNQAIKIANQLLPTPNCWPKATKHLPIFGNCPPFLKTVTDKIVQTIKMTARPATHASVDHKTWV